MCRIKHTGKKAGRKFDISITCEITGKPINKSNKYGMFCEDMCELEECKRAEKMGSELIRSFLNFFDSLETKKGAK